MSQSRAIFDRALKTIPGGVNSPVRAFNGVGGDPVFFKRAQGPYLFDVDNNRYIDYMLSWGPMILGHQDNDVLNSVESALKDAMSFGAPTLLEVELAEFICEHIPSIEQIRMVCSGSEATMTALRLARGYTGKDMIVKFEGCYHGHSDSLLIKAGSGALTLGQPSSPGVPADIAKHTLNLEFNNSDALIKAFAEHGDKIAAVIVEPVAGNMGCVPPNPTFLQTLRTVCDNHHAVLIFDEVITGFRVAFGGAQKVYNITPDITTFGKIIGGGMPVAALGGKKAIMSHLAPVGPVYQAGTLAGNPVAMAAGLATLTKLKAPGFYDKIQQKTDILVHGFTELAQKHGIPLKINSVCGMFTLFFNDKPVMCFSDVMRSNVDRFKHFFHGMLKQGIYFGPSAFESAFVSIAHTEETTAYTLDAADKVFATLKNV